MKISVVLGILILAVLFVTLLFVEFVYTDDERASICLDKHKDAMKEKYKKTADPTTLLQYMEESINNKPFVYRQTFLLALFGSVLSTVFVFATYPQIQVENFFPIFFIMMFVFFMELAFINYHYYQQKEEMVQTGIEKLRSSLLIET